MAERHRVLKLKFARMKSKFIKIGNMNSPEIT